jgi:hypothetical protein
MSDLRTAAQQALEAMEYHVEQTRSIWKTSQAIDALRDALAQQDEPKGGGNLPPPLAGRAGAAAQREKLAHWMRNLGYATGHGDTIEDLLDHLGTQIAEGLEVEVLMEREACARVCDDKAKETFSGQCQVWGDYFARVIRARSKT